MPTNQVFREQGQYSRPPQVVLRAARPSGPKQVVALSPHCASESREALWLSPGCIHSNQTRLSGVGSRHLWFSKCPHTRHPPHQVPPSLKRHKRNVSEEQDSQRRCCWFPLSTCCPLHAPPNFQLPFHLAQSHPAGGQPVRVKLGLGAFPVVPPCHSHTEHLPHLI